MHGWRVMGHAGRMHLPGPIRAAVGLVAAAADEARHLPDKAIELPMLAVSTALQASLRAQQRYARYAALGDQVLNRKAPTEEPPAWATFDEPVSVEEIRRSAIDDFPGAGSLIGNLFAVDDPTQPADPSDAAPKPKKASKKSSVEKSGVEKSGVEKSGVEKSGVEKSGVEKAAKKSGGKSVNKGVNKPRHTAASAFDNVDDDPATDED
jgi:hypothetical protein